MPDRVKYFLLVLLFLVVAGVIAYDRWNSRDGLPESEVAARDDASTGRVFLGPRKTIVDERDAEPANPPLIIDDKAIKDEPDTRPAPVQRKPKSLPGPLPTHRKRVHVVKSGEALEKISRMYYPGKVYKGVQLIVKANGLPNANVISEGQKLVIPAMDARPTRRPVLVDSSSGTRSDSSTGPAKPAPRPKRGVPSVYVVKSGDGDLYSICRRFYGRNGEGARVARIMEANNLWSVNVKSGTRIKLPKK